MLYKLLNITGLPDHFFSLLFIDYFGISREVISESTYRRGILYI